MYPNTICMEHFAHGAEMMFVDNLILKKILPETHKPMREWWLRRLGKMT
jgi:hypothetical protein